MVTTGNIVDDLPDEDRVLVDLEWLESKFRGVMPFEVLIDGQRPGQILSPSNLKRIEKFQNLLRTYPEFSGSLSAVDAVKFGVQAFLWRGPRPLPVAVATRAQLHRAVFPGAESAASDIDDANAVTNNFVDSTKTVTRVSANMADIGTLEMEALMADLQPRIDSIFPPERFNLTITGTSIVFLEGTNYLVKNLAISMTLAILVIALVMATLFRSADGGHRIDSQPASLAVHGWGDGLDGHSDQALDHLGVFRGVWHFCGRHDSLFGQIQTGTSVEWMEHPGGGARRSEGNGGEHDVHVDRPVFWVHDVRLERI